VKIGVAFRLLVPAVAAVVVPVAVAAAAAAAAAACVVTAVDEEVVGSDGSAADVDSVVEDDAAGVADVVAVEGEVECVVVRWAWGC